MLNKARSAVAPIPWIWLIAGLALVLRLLMVPYGLPYEFDPDERLFVDAAWQMVEGGAWDPGWNGVPASTLMDILAAVYALYGSAGAMLGSLDSIVAAGEAYRADVSHFFIIARVVTAISGVAVVLMTYAVARELRVPAFWAAIAAALMALSFAMIQYSGLIRPDMLTTTFLLATVLVMLRTLDRPSAMMFVIGGVFLGLAATSKYPGVLAVVPIVAVNTTLVVEHRITPRRGLLWLAAAAAASFVVAVIVGPYLFVNFADTIRAVAGEARGTHLGADGGGVIGNLWRYLTEALPWGLGGSAALVGVLGLVAMPVWRRPRIVSLTFWFFALFLSVLALWWFRWALPLLPLAAIAAVFLLGRLDSLLVARRPGRWIWVVRAVVAVVLVGPLLQPTFDGVRARATNDDTRLRAIEWVRENVPEGSTLLTDSYTTQLATDRYDIVIAERGTLVHWADISDKLRPDGYFASIAGEWFGTPEELMAAMEDEGVEYLMLADVWIDLFRDAAETYPDQLATYEALLDTYPVIETFDDDDASAGWHISIHDVAGVNPSD